MKDFLDIQHMFLDEEDEHMFFVLDNKVINSSISSENW